MSFRRILIAIDGEPLAAHAAEIGIELTVCLSAEIAFIHVIDPSLTQATGITPADLIGEARHEARRLIAGFCRLLPSTQAHLEFIHVGKPAHEIVRTAKEWPADLIVVGSHGRHGFQRALLGSTAEEVTRHAACPVLVVRAP